MAGEQHYFSEQPAASSDQRTLRVELDDVDLTLTTDAGTFSPRQLDPGTRVLLEGATAPRTDGALLDVGCGYGPIALTMATRYPGRQVFAVDVNNRALELAARNATAAGLSTVVCLRPEEVPQGQRFAAIYSNPPIRIGKAALHELLTLWLGRLLPGGHACLVVNRNLGADSLAGWLAEQNYHTERLRSRRGFRLFEVFAGQ